MKGAAAAEGDRGDEQTSEEDQRERESSQRQQRLRATAQTRHTTVTVAFRQEGSISKVSYL